MKRFGLLPSLALAATVGLAACMDQPTAPAATDAEPSLAAANATGSVRINVGLKTGVTAQIRTELSAFGKITEEIPQIDVVVLQGKAGDIGKITKLSYVAFAEVDAEVSVGPRDAVLAEDFQGGLSTWNLDAINVTAGPGFDRRVVSQTGAGVYVGVLDTGLTHNWRLYFPEERIATEYAVAFGGGPNSNSANPVLPGQWQHDVNSHGTHVVSTIIGFNLNGTPVTGVAPEATIIPVKVLGQTGRGWTSMVAKGITYIADLKAGPLSGSPMVINMSLGGGPSGVKDRAVDYAIDRGVIIVASAGNSGTAGMGYPGAYQPVISVASAGWGDCNIAADPVTRADCYGQWTASNWWWGRDVPETFASGYADQFYISGFSSRQLAGQDLDVVAPGHWIVGPYDVNSAAKSSFYYLSGTSMASPHVAGIVALMLEKNSSLRAPQVESILEAAAEQNPMEAGTHHPLSSGLHPTRVSWGADATGHGFITANAALARVP